MYEPTGDPEPAGCRDALLLTRAVFAVILPALAAILLVLGLLAAAVFLLAVHPMLALLPVVALALVIILFARWERGRFRPPDDL